MTSKIIYKGNLRTEATHLSSNALIQTDAPVDNHGKGENFSPTDLVATALASCMLTIMGITSNAHHINITDTKAEVTKIMVANPRRIGRIEVTLYIQGQETFSAKEKMILKHAAMTCPVFESLHTDIEKIITFFFNGIEEN
ncbi:MAG: osmotically inducible protein OsmC [Bacteroidetes bacterium 43-16]|nr:MAG: osmotically inducible protein OsmC [Bacteroidetes bacterium 43-16]